NAFTCVGYAPSKGRRCRNPINQHNRGLAYDLLDRISLLSPTSSQVAKLLPQLASLSLCLRFHQDQVNSVVSEWATRASKGKDGKSKVFEARSDPTTSYYSFFKDENLKRGKTDDRKQKQQKGEQQREEQQYPGREKKEQKKEEQEAKERKRQEEDAREKKREQ